MRGYIIMLSLLSGNAFADTFESFTSAVCGNENLECEVISSEVFAFSIPGMGEISSFSLNEFNLMHAASQSQSPPVPTSAGPNREAIEEISEKIGRLRQARGMCVSAGAGCVIGSIYAKVGNDRLGKIIAALCTAGAAFCTTQVNNAIEELKEEEAEAKKIYDEELKKFENQSPVFGGGGESPTGPGPGGGFSGGSGAPKIVEVCTTTRPTTIHIGSSIFRGPPMRICETTIR